MSKPDKLKVQFVLDLVRVVWFFFGALESKVLDSKEKTLLNDAITKMILSSLRPYEITNEPFFADVLCKAMEVGARHGKSCSTTCSFDLTSRNKLISGDGVWKNLDKVYEDTVKF